LPERSTAPGRLRTKPIENIYEDLDEGTY